MPMDRSLYPPNWNQIALEIKTQATWRCQECDRPCKPPNKDWAEFFAWLVEFTCWEPEFDKRTRFVLTVAHLDHVPANCDRSNLKALCSVCHLRYDSRDMALKKRLKAERLGQLTLFNNCNG